MLHQIGRVLYILPRQRVMHGFGRITIPRVPVRSALVRCPDLLSRENLRQPGLQKIRKEVVVTKPLTVIVQRDDKDVRPV